MPKFSFSAALFLAPLLPIAPASAQPTSQTPVSIAISDVRGLSYREVTLARPVSASEIYVEGVKSSPQPAVRLWITPTKAGETPRGLGWNGVEYELKSVGAPADWRADVEAQLKPKPRDTRYFLPRAFEFSGGPIAQLFLDQLGAPELRRGARLRKVSYGNADAETEYKRNLRNAGVTFFVQGDFGQAKRQLQILAASPVETRSNAYNPREEAARVLADIARRQNDLPRPTDEIAGLIWDLQNAHGYQYLIPGSLTWDRDETVQKLVEAGDRAVEPLLDALETDDRLTLSLGLPRFFLSDEGGSLGTVRDAAESTLEILLRHRYAANGYRLTPVQRHLEVARQMRADWKRMKGQTPLERVFGTLASQNQAPQRLEEAARELLRTRPLGYTFFNRTAGRNGAISESNTPFGEPLRTRQNPSVSDVLEARIAELSNRALGINPTASTLSPAAPDNINAPDAFAPNRAMNAANALTLVAMKWDPKRAAPLLGVQLERAKRFAAAPSGFAEESQRSAQTARRQFFIARLNTQERAAAMREYGEFLQSAPFGRFSEADYIPLWRYAGEPAMIQATKALFSAPRRPFEDAAKWKTSGFNYDTAYKLLYSPLVRLPLVKAAVARELGNKTVIGEVRATQKGVAEARVTGWNWLGPILKITPPRLENGATQPLRVCDLVGSRLLENQPDARHLPRYYPLLDLSLPTSKRDARLRQIGVLLGQNRVAMRDFGFENAN